MPRGRLIFPFIVQIARLDTVATAADPDGTGALTSGYDPDFRSTRRRRVVSSVPQPSPTSITTRVESTPIDVLVQIEPQVFEALRQFDSGNSPDSEIKFVAHYKNLERDGLVDAATGEPLIRVNDRLVAVRRKNGDLVRTIRNPPGLYVNEVRDIGQGLGLGLQGSHRNLLLLTFMDRIRSTQT